MSTQIGINENLIKYLVANGYRSNELIDKLIAETLLLGGVAQMQIAPEQGQFLEIIIDCAEEMGMPCNGEWVEVEGQCCSDCVENVDLNEITNEGFSLIKMIDILGREKTEHKEGMILFYIYENGKVIKRIK